MSPEPLKTVKNMIQVCEVQNQYSIAQIMVNNVLDICVSCAMLYWGPLQNKPALSAPSTLQHAGCICN